MSICTQRRLQRAGIRFALVFLLGFAAALIAAQTAVARAAAGNPNPSPAVQINVASPPVAAYAYNEGAGSIAVDGSATNNTATVSGATWSSNCRFGGCLSFNGTNSFVESPDHTALTPGTAATFEAWVLLAAAPGETTSIFNKWSQTADDEYLFGVNPGRTLFFAWHTTGTGSWPSLSFNAANSIATIPLNTLTHVAVVRNGTTLKFYINGTPGASLNVMDGNPFRNGISTLRIGGQGRGAANRFFNGVVDEARIYNRALTDAEIQSDMNTPIAPDVRSPIISAIAASAITAAGATIGWTTDEASSTQVEYGTTTAYGGTSPLNVGLTSAHRVVLAGLAANTLYHYRVSSRDAAGNLAVSGDFTFTTVVADVGLPVVSITAPAANATVSGIVPVTATAADNVGVVGVQFRVDGVNLGAEDTTAPFSLSWNSTATAAGSHWLSAIARDAAGNVGTSSAVAVVVATNAAANLVGAYAYNEGAGSIAADGSATNNPATVSAATWSSNCRFGGCLSFNGTNSFVESPDHTALTPGTAATFEAWVLLAAAPGETTSIFNKWSQTADDEYLFGVNPGRTLFFAWHTTGTGSWPSLSFNAANSIATIPLNTLTHVAVVRNGTTLKFYINGNPGASLNVMDGNPFRNGINTLRVGGQGRGAANRFFNGVVDEARIYNRALTDAEIQSDMNTPVAPDVRSPIISAIAASAITAAGATIGWTTDEASSTQVEYGTTTAYGSTTPLNVSPVTAHWAILGGLAPTTLYHYRVKSRDAAANLATSGDLTFTTPAVDLTLPAVAITAPAANATVSGVVTVAATATDNVGVAGVQFRLDGAALGPEDAIAPFATAWSTATAPVGAHTLTAVAWDAAGNQRTSAGIVVTVSNPQVRLAWNASPDTAVSGYTVHVADASRIYSTRLTVGNVTAYTVAGLQPGQLYYFAVTAHTATALESVASNEVTTTTP